jgi:hypothetical protein
MRLASLAVVFLAGCGTALQPLATPKPAIVLNDYQLGRYYLGYDKVFFPKGTYPAKYQEGDLVLYESPEPIILGPKLVKLPHELVEKIKADQAAGLPDPLVTGKTTLNGIRVQLQTNCRLDGDFLVDRSGQIYRRGGIAAHKDHPDPGNAEVWMLDQSLGPNKYVRGKVWDVRFEMQK